jgi:predicted transcriptional regulator
MTKSQIFTLAHEQRRSRGISMSLALRQVYAAMRARGSRQMSRGRVVSHEVDLGAWLTVMTTRKAYALAEYGIPSC